MTRHLQYWLKKNKISYDNTEKTKKEVGIYIRPRDEKKVVEHLKEIGMYKEKEDLNGLILIIFK